MVEMSKGWVKIGESGCKKGSLTWGCWGGGGGGCVGTARQSRPVELAGQTARRWCDRPKRLFSKMILDHSECQNKCLWRV